MSALGAAGDTGTMAHRAWVAAKAPTRRLISRDATTLLTLFIVLMLGLPARYVFGPLGGAGAPFQLLAMGGMLWWATHRLMEFRPSAGISQPVRRAALLLLAAILASYVAASVRPISPDEMRGADRGLLVAFAWMGILLVATDGIPSRERLDTLLRRLSIAGGAVAALGLVQFQTGQLFTDRFRLPGLTETSAVSDVPMRDGFFRPTGTAVHPIEFGVALSILLPIALHYAMTDTHRSVWRRWAPVVLIAGCMSVSLSRSTIICSVIALAFLFPTWPAAVRRRASVAIIGLLAVVYVLVPGMLSTMLNLFGGVGNDSSAQSRTDAYASAVAFISRAPVFGRGFGTFFPSYHILDNQYLGTIIELGFVGLAALLGLYLTGIVSALRIRRRSHDTDTRQLAQALAAAAAAGATSFALFDAFSFATVPSLMFLVLGTIGGLRRIEIMERRPLPVVPLPPPTGRIEVLLRKVAASTSSVPIDAPTSPIATIGSRSVGGEGRSGWPRSPNGPSTPGSLGMPGPETRPTPVLREPAPPGTGPADRRSP